MKSAKKVLRMLMIAVMVFSIGSVFAESKKPVFKFGIVAPLTGNIAFIGEGMKEALTLAKEQLKDTKYDYQIIYEDDANDQKLAANAANKLTSIDHVDALMSLDSPSGNVISPIATKQDVIHFGIAVDPNVAKGPNNFLHWTPAKQQAKLLAEEVKKRGMKTFGLFGTVSQVGWKVYGEEVIKAFDKAGVKLVTKQDFHDGTKDFRILIAKAKPTNPDIYVIEAPTPELEILVKQMREAGIKQPLTGIETFEVSKELDLFEGLYYVSAVEPTGEYVRAMEKKYGKNPAICSGNAYDIFNIIVSTVERIGKNKKPTTAELSKELHKLKNYKGALGNLSIDSDGFVLSSAQLKVVKKGKFVPLYAHK
jgi:branched-chain amino acid transport system substrate-binding protein